jgi:protein TonB
MLNDPAHLPANIGRKRTRSLFVVALGASVAAHAAVFSVLPGLMRGTESPPVALEVRVVQSVPLPVAPSEPEVAPPPRNPQPRRETGSAVRDRRQEQPAPILSLPAAQAPANSPFTVPDPRPAEALPRPEQKTQVASIAVAPPVVGAAYLRNPEPPYPAAARRNGVQGTVLLRVVVTSKGLPARVEVEKSSGSVHLDNAALEAVKAWRFTPARRGAETVEGIVTVPIVFRLESAS